MDAFLKLVAQDLYSKVGNDMSRIMVVFPNKRASLFFNEYLAQQTDSPLWSPAYISINELIHSFSSLTLGDSILLICELYEIFRQETKNEETLDEFYFWGEMLINDFDDLDKNLVDAEKLFCNLKDLKQIMDGFDFLDEEQEQAIQHFFQNFSIEKRTQLKEKFISLWDTLGSIYEKYRKVLSDSGIAYEGMIYRDAVSNLKPEKLPYDKYIFVGFNLLSKCEFRLFKRLQEAEKALFYWDYDEFYTNTLNIKHEAGIYLNRNLKNFPCTLDKQLFSNLRKPKKVRIISSPTENAQARFLPEWMNSIETANERENAVVLCNETLLLSVLNSIPQNVENVNITMGFPLSQTPAYTFISAFIELHIMGYNKETGRYSFHHVQALLKHPYCKSISPAANFLERQLTKNNRFYPLPSELKQDEFLGKLFAPQQSITSLCQLLLEIIKDITLLYRGEEEDNNIYTQLYKESLFKSYTVINRIHNLLDTDKLKVQVETFKRLITGLLASINIPFHGEPAIGMQVMGILETRNLDFKNLLLMSVNEKLLPKSKSDSSFIPYNLRKAFGMSTVDHQDATYSYYFYRMIQRAEDVTILYNTSTDGLNGGEASRFLLQFLVESPHTIERLFLEAGQSPRKADKIVIKKTPDILDILDKTYSIENNSKGISPSALNTYLDCNLKFYFRYVIRIKERTEVTNEIDAPTFGSIFHRVVELIYTKLTAKGNTIHKEDIEHLLKNHSDIQNIVDKAFKELFFHIGKEEKSEYNGIQLINFNVITTYAKQLLRNDLQYAPFDMVAMEKNVSEVVEIETPRGIKKIRLGGVIDRIDSKDGTLRIVDYKTGGSPKMAKDMKDIFTPKEGRPGYIFQTFLYASIMCRQNQLKIAPALLYIHKASSETYSPVIKMGELRNKQEVNDFKVYEEDFRENLNNLLQEIYNPDVPFNQTENKKICEYCDYKILCKR